MSKFKNSIAIIMAGSAILIAGCSKSSSDHSNASLKPSPKSPTEQIKTNSGLWFSAKDYNQKSKSGFEAFEFKGDKVTLYTASKIAKTTSDQNKIKKDGKMGDGKYSIKTKGSKTIVNINAKISGIPANYKFTIKGKTAKSTKSLRAQGFTVDKTVDHDTVSGILVQPVH